MSAFKDWLNGLTSKSTPVDADELYVRDSSGTPGSKKLTWANLKATISTYFGLIPSSNTLEQRNGTNAQTSRIYNTYTDASNYERGFMRWASNVLEIGAEAAGTGTQRNTFIGTYPKGICVVPASNAIYMQPSGGIGPVFKNAGMGFDGWTDGIAYTLFGNTQAGNPNRTGANVSIYPLGGSGNGAAGQVDIYASLAAESGTAGHTFEKALSTVLPAAGSPGILFAGFSEFAEMTAPSAPATNGVRIYAEDNGSGKTRLMALFATGSAVQIAIEP